MIRPNLPFTALTAALAMGSYHLDAAAIVALPAYSSHVTDVVNDNGNGTWTYDFAGLTTPPPTPTVARP